MTAATTYFDELFDQQPVMAILRGMDPAATVELCGRAWDLGVTAVEVTLHTPDALPALEAAIAAGRERGRQVGAGTITTAEQVADVVRVGGTFAVAPGMDESVARAAADAGLPYLPGVATSSEIQAAARLGLQWLKAFPAAQLTPGWFTAQLAPFPRVRFVATGGVDARNAQAFLDAGARVVGVGSALADPAQVEQLSQLRG
jgi:2-dehydro-3-deoxyphosphogluconate aldolase/(4S)-4-hydroxy-2-oxoglutarate aldolase